MIHCLEGGSHQIHLLSFVGLGSLLVEEGGGWVSSAEAGAGVS